MNKGVLIAIAVVAVLGLGGFFVISRNNQNPSSISDSSGNSPEAAKISEAKSIKDLLSIGTNQQCTFTDADSKSSGKIYIGSGKMRGDFESTTTVNDKVTTITGHMISDAKDVYIWMDGQTQGFKSSVEATEDASPDSKNGVDINKKIDYNCGAWGIDSSFFAVPTNVKFQDFSSVTTPPTTGESSDTKAKQCAVCDSAPADSKAACKQALGCN